MILFLCFATFWIVLLSSLKSVLVPTITLKTNQTKCKNKTTFVCNLQLAHWALHSWFHQSTLPQCSRTKLNPQQKNKQEKRPSGGSSVAGAYQTLLVLLCPTNLSWCGLLRMFPWCRNYQTLFIWRGERGENNEIKYRKMSSAFIYQSGHNLAGTSSVRMRWAGTSSRQHHRQQQRSWHNPSWRFWS